MKSKKIAAVVLGSIVLAASALPAMAETRKDALNNVYINGLAPGSSHEISLDGTPRTRTATANRCGVAKVSPSLAYSAATEIKLGMIVSDIPSLPVLVPGNCSSVNGIYTSVNAPSATKFKDSIGAIYFQGLAPSSDQIVTYPELSVGRNIAANACGYIKISNTTSSPITSASVIRFNGNSYGTVDNMSMAIAPSCKKISATQSVMMIGITDRYNWGS
jgi:hypothetical protein